MRRLLAVAVTIAAAGCGGGSGSKKDGGTGDGSGNAKDGPGGDGGGMGGGGGGGGMDAPMEACAGCVSGTMCIPTAIQTDSACGMPGSVCMPCPVGKRCEGGECKPFCDKTNCPSGCCSGTACVAAPTAMFCGLGGEACKACAGCEKCAVDGTCKIDPESTWTIRCVDAEIEPAKSSGASWDAGKAAPDPFCRFELPTGTLVKETAYKESTFMPVWDEAVTTMPVKAKDLLAGGKSWKLEVLDYDGFSANDRICGFMEPMLEKSLTDRGFERTKWEQCKRIKIALVCMP